MPMKLMNIGFGNLINMERVVAVVSTDSSPAKRMMQTGKERGRLIDATHGRKTKSVLITDSDHIVLSYLEPEMIEKRLAEEG